MDDQAHSNRSNGHILWFSLNAASGFALGIMGNKLAELISIPPAMVIIISLFMFIVYVSIGIKISGINIEANNYPRLLRAITTNKLTAFASYFISGIMLAIFGVNFTPTWFTIPVPGRFELWDYEKFMLFITIPFLYLMMPKATDGFVVLYGCLGLSLGVSSTILFLRPDQNHPGNTLTVWLVLELCALIIARSQTMTGFIQDCRWILQLPDIVAQARRQSTNGRI